MPYNHSVQVIANPDEDTKTEKSSYLKYGSKIMPAFCAYLHCVIKFAARIRLKISKSEAPQLREHAEKTLRFIRPTYKKAPVLTAAYIQRAAVSFAEIWQQ
jgi:hypothetical protein